MPSIPSGAPATDQLDLSVVAPHFAQKPQTRPKECGFHMFDGRKWRRFAPWERPWRVAITGGEAPLLLVGERGQ